jgi:DNA repair photolyase
MITKIWDKPATIEANNFKFKSLSNWSYNIAVGCEHGCTFCYVPQVSTTRGPMAAKLAEHGVKDPDAEWGDYVFLRKWDADAFRRSLNACFKPGLKLAPDGNRAVMFCTTTDPYQVGRDMPCEHCNGLGLVDISRPDRSPYMVNCSRCVGGIIDFQVQRRLLVRTALEEILTKTDLNVRILTRSPLVREDFDLMKRFGHRLLFGMSIPTLNNRLAKIYEPRAPAPTQRLATLKAAKAAGLNVYVAVAPVYPDCGIDDMVATLRAVKELDPVTIFMEPINIRAHNVARINAEAQKHGMKLKTEVFARPDVWRDYAVRQLASFEAIARNLDITDSVIHLWPDKTLGSKDCLRQFDEQSHNWNQTRITYADWLQSHWSKISAWPKPELARQLANLTAEHWKPNL